MQTALSSIYAGMNRISNIICKILEVIIVLVVVINAADVFLQVFNRAVLVKISDISLSWTDELARYSMIWICYCTLGICFREGSMAQVDLIYGRPPRQNGVIPNNTSIDGYGDFCLYQIWAVCVRNTRGLQICDVKYSRAISIQRPNCRLYSCPV